MRRPLACGQLCRPEVGVPRRPVPSARTAVSLPCGAMPGEQRCAARSPAASCADRRSAFPGGRGHLHEWRCLCLAASSGGAAIRRPLACGQLCRPEVGVPWRLVPSARMAMSLPCGVMRGSSDAPPAGLRPAVPTGGRRSPAAGALRTNGAVSTPRRHAGGAAMRRPLACGQLCRAPPGELPRGRRSPAAGALRTNGAVSTPRRHAGEQRCAARWPAASCAGPHRENCPEVGVPSRPRAFLAWWRTAERAKNNGSELRSLPA